MENYNNDNDLAQQENDLSQTVSELEQVAEQNNIPEDGNQENASVDTQTDSTQTEENSFESVSTENTIFSVSDNAYKSAPFFKSLFSLKFGDISIVHRIILSLHFQF